MDLCPSTPSTFGWGRIIINSIRLFVWRGEVKDYCRDFYIYIAMANIIFTFTICTIATLYFECPCKFVPQHFVFIPWIQHAKGPKCHSAISPL